jgi:hypothetical protein
MTITGTVVRTWLLTARLPITLAESTVRRGDRTDGWPPALAFGAFEAGVKQVVGALTHDKQLAVEGRLEQVQIAQLRKAIELESIADARQNKADVELRERLDADEQRLSEIDDQARARLDAEEARLQEEARRAEQKAQKKAVVAQKAETETLKAVKKVDRSARATRVSVERNAVAKKRGAVAAKKSAAKVDSKLEATRAARRAAR